MKKTFSLIKASMTEDMNLFKVSTKNKSNFTKIALPILIAFLLMGMVYYYAETMMEGLANIHMEVTLLALFIIITSAITIVEGVYKSGNLLFNCKDDNLLLSLPIKKRTVLFIRLFKFYIFELLYNSLFLLPAIAVYAIHIHPGAMYYVISIVGLLVFPIFPIIISCIVGAFITFIASKFKGKNHIQTLITVIFLLGVFYVSYNLEGLMGKIAENATSINDIITKLYYPAGAYVELVTNFNALKLLEFLCINLGAFALTILIIGKVYFKINSNVKSIKVNKSNKDYKIKSRSPMRALIKKELSRFVNSTVFISNAGFGLVLFILGCILIAIKFDSMAEGLGNIINMPIDYINSFMPVIILAFVCFASFMTSITSSMISLEGKSFNILKSLPVKPYTIVQAKVLAAILVMIPCILIGDIIVFIRFRFDILSMILILAASVLLPLISETIGILINLKYPRMDAKNDTEVVKQSMSSTISVFIGMFLIGITLFLLFMAIQFKIEANIIMLVFTGVYALIYGGLTLLLHKTSDKKFNNIVV